MRKVRREDGLALHLVVCDELAFYLTLPDKRQRQEFAELLRDLVARGRAAGVIVCAAKQKPGTDVVPSALRDLFGFRLALRCNMPQASDTILGQGWATAGADASTIPGGQRGVGYLWSPADIGRLLAAARALRPPLRAATFEALFGLLAVTGMRVGEAVALARADVDPDDGVITIRAQIAKLERTRLIPLHPTTTDALRRYAAERERLCPRPRSTAFFLSRTGTALDRSSVAKTLRQITTALGLRSQTVRPRAQDLRHTFAVRTLIDWQRSGQVARASPRSPPTSGTSAPPRPTGTCRRPRS